MITNSQPASFVVRRFFSCPLSMINDANAWLPNGCERVTMLEFLSFGVFTSWLGLVATLCNFRDSETASNSRAAAS